MTQFRPLFDLPVCPESTGALPIIGVPWEKTTSYRTGTGKAPEHIAAATTQVDLHHALYGTQIADTGVVYHPLPIEPAWKSEDLDAHLYDCVRRIYRTHHTIGLIGGEHSLTAAVVRALATHHPQLGILHIDSHFDLRPNYQNSIYSHASVMYRCLPYSSAITAVGIRDYSSEEATIAADNRITTWSDWAITQQLAQGQSWHAITQAIIASCPDVIYLTLDIDGLTPACCPDTGTPVPGGLSYRDLQYLLYQLYLSKKRVIGFDLVEVAGEAHSTGIITAAHLLYTLCGLIGASRDATC